MATKPTGLSNLKVLADRVQDIRDMIRLLSSREVLVGFPEDTTARESDLGTTTKGKANLGGASDITNASLGYIHDHGMPEQNIPARPFMIPGIKAAVPKILTALEFAAKQVLQRSGTTAVDQGFERAGIAAQFGIRNAINEGIPPPLSEYTLRERARRGRKGAKQELTNRAAGLPSSTYLAKPLVDTGQLRNAINYVIRERKARRR